jgi:hypothetical protein
MRAAISVLKPDPLLAPTSTICDQLKLLPKQWMVRMRYSEDSLLSVPMRRICRPKPTPCARVFSPRSNVNCSTAIVSRIQQRPAAPSSNSLKDGITSIAAIRDSTTCHQSNTRGAIRHTLVTAAQHRLLKRGRSSQEDHASQPLVDLGSLPSRPLHLLKK